MFSFFENSNFSGRPVHFYDFSWGAKVWRYTSADRDITFEGETWLAVAISDDGVILGAGGQPFKVTAPANLPLVALYRGQPPGEKIKLRARRWHWSDDETEVHTYWSGEIINVQRKNRAEALILGSVASLRRTGLRLCWERNCPHMLYDQDCKADREQFKTETTITAMTGTTITVATAGNFPAEWFPGGYIMWQADPAPAFDRRGIQRQVSGLTFELLGSTDRLEVGMPITMYLGCDLTAQSCRDKFNNLANHGGFAFMPGKSPFDGDPVF
jgi:uncharacterized phage protein (TIGR02218 family)